MSAGYSFLGKSPAIVALLLGLPPYHTPAAPATTRDLAPLSATEIIDVLASSKKIREKVQESRMLRARKALSMSLKSPQEAMKLYERAIEHSSPGSLSSWKKSNAPIRRSEIFQEALRMRIWYTWLSLSSNHPEIARKTLDYSKSLSNFVMSEEYLNSPHEVKNLLNASVGAGVLFQYLELDGLIPSEEKWEQVPANIPSILEKSVRSPSRHTDPLLLEESWQVELDFRDNLARKAPLSEREKYIKIDKPSLMFRRAQDMSRSGLPNRSARETLSLINNHPEHKEYEKWEAYLRQYVSSPAENPGKTQ